MDNYYSLLGVPQNASFSDIKRAFREKAKRLHPDIAGARAGEGMRKLLAAYRVLSDRDRRFEYDRVWSRFVRNPGFDYRTWLREQEHDPASRAKLVFFELLHLEEEEALEIWRKGGGLRFSLEKYLDREDYMDCLYLLAEELDRRGDCFEAFVLLTRLVREERRLPYFRHFMEDIETFLRELVRLRLKSRVDGETWLECLETLLSLEFPPRDEARWMRSMAETLLAMGEDRQAEAVIREALRRDPALPDAARLRKKLRV